jgi:hypothetical protein
MATVSPMTLRQGDLQLLDRDLAQCRYAAPEQAVASIAQVDHPGTKMARIAVRPTWVGGLSTS